MIVFVECIRVEKMQEERQHVHGLRLNGEKDEETGNYTAREAAECDRIDTNQIIDNILSILML